MAKITRAAFFAVSCLLALTARLAHAVTSQGLGTIKHIQTVQHRRSQSSGSNGLASGTATHLALTDEALYDSSGRTDDDARQGKTYEDDYAYLLEDVHMAGKSGGFQSDDDSPLFRRHEASQQLTAVVVGEEQEEQSDSSSSSGLLGWAEEEDAIMYGDKAEEYMALKLVHYDVLNADEEDYNDVIGETDDSLNMLTAAAAQHREDWAAEDAANLHSLLQAGDVVALDKVLGRLGAKQLDSMMDQWRAARGAAAAEEEEEAGATQQQQQPGDLHGNAKGSRAADAAASTFLQSAGHGHGDGEQSQGTAAMSRRLLRSRE